MVKGPMNKRALKIFNKLTGFDPTLQRRFRIASDALGAIWYSRPAHRIFSEHIKQAIETALPGLKVTQGKPSTINSMVFDVRLNASELHATMNALSYLSIRQDSDRRRAITALKGDEGTFDGHLKLQKIVKQGFEAAVGSMVLHPEKMGADKERLAEDWLSKTIVVEEASEHVRSGRGVIRAVEDYNGDSQQYTFDISKKAEEFGLRY